MNWICHRCGGRNGSVSGICGKCFEIRSPNAQLVEDPEEATVARYMGEQAPTLFARYFSTGHRITRREFTGVFVLCILALVLIRAMVAQFDEPAVPLLAYAALVFTLAVFTVAALKRGRDLDVKPLWTVFFAGSTWGVIGLLFFPGTAGANQYGPDPRSRYHR